MKEDLFHAELNKDVPAYIFSVESENEFLWLGQVIQSCLKKWASDTLRSAEDWIWYKSLQRGPDCFDEVMTQGELLHVIGGRVVYYKPTTYVDCWTHTLICNEHINDLAGELKRQIRWHNPIRHQHLRIFTADYDEVRTRSLPPPEVRWEDLVLPPTLKADLYANTLDHLLHGEGVSCVTFDGPHGTGKSLACQTLIAEALRLGFSTCHLVDSIPFEYLERLIVPYLLPCLFIIEEVDSLAKNPIDVDSDYFADFLNFLLGLHAAGQHIAVVATLSSPRFMEGNRKRPKNCFNRHYHFDLPTPDRVDQFLDQFFGEMPLPQELRSLCYGRGMTGAHVRELRRTVQLLSEKKQQPIESVFRSALSRVEKEFAITPARYRITNQGVSLCH